MREELQGGGADQGAWIGMKEAAQEMFVKQKHKAEAMSEREGGQNGGRI
jgi:hypothetical protein